MHTVQGAGAYGRVYKALRGGVQDVAVKQLIHTGDGQMEQFISVCPVSHLDESVPLPCM